MTPEVVYDYHRISYFLAIQLGRLKLDLSRSSNGALRQAEGQSSNDANLMDPTCLRKQYVKHDVSADVVATSFLRVASIWFREDSRSLECRIFPVRRVIGTWRWLELRSYVLLSLLRRNCG